MQTSTSEVVKPTITIGCDPEIFVSSGQSAVSAHNLVPGTKKEPYKVEGGAIQVDGTALEFNINPARTYEEFDKNISSVLGTMSKMMQEKDPYARFKWIPSRKYTKARWASIPEYAKEMGCDPDLNAYTGQENPRPHSEFPTLRSAGGHIHVGWTKDKDINDPRHVFDCRFVAMLFDATLFQYSKLWDKDETRRLLYGTPGSIRIKPYGVEYRTLSNMWVSSIETQRFVFVAVKVLMKTLTDGEFDPWFTFRVSTLIKSACSGSKEDYDRIVNGEFLRENRRNYYTLRALDHYAKEFGLLPKEA